MAIAYSLKVAAEESGLSQRTIFSAIKDGRLPVLRVGRRVLIAPADLEAFLRRKSTKERDGVQ